MGNFRKSGAFGYLSQKVYNSRTLLGGFLVASSSPADASTYRKKRPYEGYGKISSVNGFRKYNTTSGHYKHPPKGYTYVYRYARTC